MWVAAQDLPRSPGHVFYEKLNSLLEGGGFDRHVEELCRAYYAEDEGRPSIPPGVYFRMLFIGYFEGLGAQRAIAWRCADSLSLRAFDCAGRRDTGSLSIRTRASGCRKTSFEGFAFVLKLAVERD
jgi:hypothetical protein